jgi:hypothetical protein
MMAAARAAVPEVGPQSSRGARRDLLRASRRVARRVVARREVLVVVVQLQAQARQPLAREAELYVALLAARCLRIGPVPRAEVAAPVR